MCFQMDQTFRSSGATRIFLEPWFYKHWVTTGPKTVTEEFGDPTLVTNLVQEFVHRLTDARLPLDISQTEIRIGRRTSLLPRSGA